MRGSDEPASVRRSSLTNRKELAKELGFTGNTSDSAAMNVWLRKRVMQ